MDNFFKVKPLNEISVTDRVKNNGYFPYTPSEQLYRARTHRRLENGDIEKITSLYGTDSRGGDYVELEYQRGNEIPKHYSGFNRMGFGIYPEDFKTWEQQRKVDDDLYSNAPKKEKQALAESWNKRKELFHSPSVGLSNFDSHNGEEGAGRTPMNNINPILRKRVTGQYQTGGVVAEIRPDNRSWIRREIVDPVRTWVMTRPGYETAVQTADIVSDFVPGVGEVKDLTRGNYLAAAIGLVPGVGDVAAKVIKNPMVKKIRIIPEGKSLVSSSESLRVRNNVAAKKLKEKRDWSVDRYGKLEDDHIGNRELHYKHAGEKNSIYGVNKDIDLQDYELDEQYSSYGQFTSPYKNNPYYKDLRDGGYTSDTGKMMLSDYLQRGGVFENSKPIQYSPHATSVPKEYKTPVFDNIDDFKKTALKVLEAAAYPISGSFIPIQGAPVTIFREFQRLSPEQLREVFQEFKDNTMHENTLTNKR